MGIGREDASFALGIAASRKIIFKVSVLVFYGRTIYIILKAKAMTFYYFYFIVKPISN